jgi:GAF domain-containing protein
VRDITERQQAEAQLRMSQERERLLAEIALRIRQSLDLEQILNRTVVEVRQFLQTDRVCICYIDENCHTKVVAESVVPERQSILDLTIANQTFSRDMMANFEQGVRAINDMSQEEIIPVSAQILQQLQVKACLGVPILLGSPPHKDHQFLPRLDKSDHYFDNQGFWVLVADQCSGARQWQSSEIDLIEQLGNQVAIAIQQAKLYQQLAALNANLERQVEERTAQLSRSNALLKAQQEASVEGILVIDENRTVASYNQLFCQLWQMPEAVIQSGDDQQLLTSVLDKLKQPEEFLAKVEYLYQHPEEDSSDEIYLKDQRILERYSKAVRSHSVLEGESLEGNYYGRVWYFRDISDRKRAEEALRESEERLRTLINATPDIICFKDGAGRWLVSNQANLEFFQLEGIDYRCKTDAELAQFSNFYRHILIGCKETDEETWQHGSTYRVEEICPRPDGTTIIFELIKVPLFILMVGVRLGSFGTGYQRSQTFRSSTSSK